MDGEEERSKNTDTSKATAKPNEENLEGKNQ